MPESDPNLTRFSVLPPDPTDLVREQTAPYAPRDFFISYNQDDRAWAEWIAWTLEEAGFSTVIQVWDNPTGADIVTFMDQSTERTRKTIAVLSDSYMRSPHCKTEWSARYCEDPSGQLLLLVHVRVHECRLNPTMRSRVYSDLFGRSEVEARSALLDAVGLNPPEPGNEEPAEETRDKPAERPPFPGDEGAEALPSAKRRSAPVETLSDEERHALAVELRSLTPAAFERLIARLNLHPADLVAESGDQDLLIEELMSWATEPGGIGLLRVRVTLDALEDAPASERQLKLDLRFVNLWIWLCALGISFLSLAYLLGSRTWLGEEFAFWDRKFNAFGGEFNDNGIQFGIGDVGWLIESVRLVILLSMTFVAMPADAFQDVVRRLRNETVLWRWLGDPGVVRPDKTRPDVQIATAVFILLGTVLLFVVVVHHLTEGPQRLWMCQGFRQEPKGALRPRLHDMKYWNSCLIPYLTYMVYSFIMFVIAVNVFFTVCAFGVVTDLIWMFKWTNGFKADCARNRFTPADLRLRFETTFLGRLRDMLERNYFVLTCVLVGIAFMVWLDRINLMPSAFQLELRALVVATLPLCLLLLVSTVFYNGAREAVAARTTGAQAFLNHHRLMGFYTQSFLHSRYTMIALLALACIAVNQAFVLIRWVRGS